VTERLLAPKWANALLIGTGIVVFLTLVLVGWGGPKIFSSTNQVKDGNDAATCRASFSARVTDARTHLDDARADLTEAQFDGLVAATVTPDNAGLFAAIARGNHAKTLMGIWQRRTLDANASYQRLIASDRAAFKRMCEDGP
jgi:hypothetical protein